MIQFLLLLLLICVLVGVYRYFYRGYLRNKADLSVIITGCDVGFGHMLTLQCAEEGHTVFASCMTQKGVDDLVSATAGMPGTVLPFLMNVCDDESVAAGVKFVEENGGSDGVWGLVNNAGVRGECGCDDWLTVQDYKHCIDVNVLGTIRCTHAFLPFIKKAEGRIILMSSILAKVILPTAGPYCVSKFAIEGYSEMIRQELRELHITVHVMQPSFYSTNLTDLDNGGESFKRVWARMPKEKREEYGDHHLEKSISLNRMIMGWYLSDRFHEVIDAYYQTLFCRRAHARVCCGWASWLLFTPMGYVPPILRDWVYMGFRDCIATPVPTYMRLKREATQKKLL